MWSVTHRARCVTPALGLTSILLAAVHGCGSAQRPSAIRLDESMLQSAQEGMPGEREWSGRIELGQGTFELARIDVTNKGNGWLKICGQEFRVYDSHADEKVFDPPFVCVTFVDFDGDGYRDLMLYSVRRVTEDGSDRVEVEPPMLRAYRYEVSLRRFSVITPDLNKEDFRDASDR